jgi:hypothetical protein
MPVLPEVGSRMIESGLSLPAFSAASIIEIAIRSLTLCAGLKNSSLASTVPSMCEARRLILTSGVLPISSVTLLAIFMLRSRQEKPASGGNALAGGSSEIQRTLSRKTVLLQQAAIAQSAALGGGSATSRKVCIGWAGAGSSHDNLQKNGSRATFAQPRKSR